MQKAEHKPLRKIKNTKHPETQNTPKNQENPEILKILIQTNTKHPEEAKEVGKEKTNDAEPCHAQIRQIAADSPQTAKGDTFFSYGMSLAIMD